MSAKADRDHKARRIRPFKPIWKTVKRIYRRLGPPPADRGYMICATPRSGSNYLSELLASTGVLGNPREYFNPDGRRRRDNPTYPDDPREQIGQVLSTGRTANGIYAVKVHHFQLDPVRRIVDPLRTLPNLHHVVLQRRDVVRQAISWSRVVQTGQHRASDIARSIAVYDQLRIRESLAFLLAERTHWKEELERARIRPLGLEYEDLLRDPQAAVDRIAVLMKLGARARIDRARVSVTIQRDQTTEEWRDRFLAETKDEFRHLT